MGVGVVGVVGGRVEMTRRELIGLIESEARLFDDREALTAYVGTLDADVGLTREQVDSGFARFKAERAAGELAEVARRHDLPPDTLTAFVDAIVRTSSFDPDALTSLAATQNLSYIKRTRWELSLMDALVPILKRRAGGRTVAGLESYEEPA